MRTTYLRKQHERALFYIESVSKVVDRIAQNTGLQMLVERKGNAYWNDHPFYNSSRQARLISKDKEFALWLMKRYETVLDNINSHSYANPS